MKLPARVACLAVFLLVSARANAAALPLETIADLSVGGHPESVIGDDNFLYVSNMGPGSDLFRRDGNGYISRLTYSGQIEDQRFLSQPGQLDAPTGMALLNDRLFVADLDEVFGFDLDGEAPPVRIDMRSEGVSFLNDLVAVSNHQVVVSATNVKKLFLVDTLTESFQEIDLDFTLSHPNGLAWDASSDRLYIAANRQHTIGANASNGEVLVVDLDVDNHTASFVSRVPNAGLFLDGISLFGEGEVIYSDWITFDRATGVLGRFDAASLTVADPTNLALRGFADFHWQQSRRVLAAPDLIGGRVRLLSLPVPEPSAGCLMCAAAMGGVAVVYRWRRVAPW